MTAESVASAIAEHDPLAEIERALEAASEERYQELKNWEREAWKWKAEGDMYGWNFHTGMAAGANWCDIFYRRIGRVIKTLREKAKDTPSQSAPMNTATREDFIQVNDTMDVAECCVHDQIKDPLERDATKDGLKCVRELALSALRTPSAIEPMNTARTLLRKVLTVGLNEEPHGYGPVPSKQERLAGALNAEICDFLRSTDSGAKNC